MFHCYARHKDYNMQPQNCIHSIVQILPEAIFPHTFQFTNSCITSGFIGNWNCRLSHSVETKDRTSMCEIMCLERIHCEVYVVLKKSQLQDHPYLRFTNQVCRRHCDNLKNIWNRKKTTFCRNRKHCQKVRNKPRESKIYDGGKEKQLKNKIGK